MFLACPQMHLSLPTHPSGSIYLEQSIFPTNSSNLPSLCQACLACPCQPSPANPKLSMITGECQEPRQDWSLRDSLLAAMGGHAWPPHMLSRTAVCHQGSLPDRLSRDVCTLPHRPVKWKCPLTGSVQGQVGWGFEQPGVVEGIPAHVKVFGTR